MEKVGVFLVSYGARCAAMAQALIESQSYEVRLYIADKQRNPLNAQLAEIHHVIPDLNVHKLCEFAKRYRDYLDFGIVGAEGPIIDGLRDIVEKETGVPVICPTKDLALERSKVEQRILLSETVPETNPAFKVFDPEDFSRLQAVEEAKKWIDERGGVNRVVIKPDKPGYGKGVGVGGEHFVTLHQAIDHFQSLFGGETRQKVIIEDKVEGEESSFQTWCDGRNLVPMPETRDYKRAFDGDIGPNTGGMGSYRDVIDHLPFMEEKDREAEISITNKLFQRLKLNRGGACLRGTPFYIAFIHTAEGPKILEINSRPGDPELMAILPTIGEDFVDICFDMLHGTLTEVKFLRKSAVVTYAVPLTYGGYRDQYSGSNEVNLNPAKELAKSLHGRLRIYPGSMEQRDGFTYALKSRAVASVGIGDDIREAREISLKGVKAIDGPLWNRWDIAGEKHIASCIEHMRILRCR